MAFLKLPTVLSANPHWYDYLHFMQLKKKGRLEMVDGGGQAINAEVRGHFEISALSATEAEFSITQFVEYHPYKKDEKRRDLPDFKTTMTKEDGVYVFSAEMWGKREDQMCLLYRTRYVFEVDPLACARENQRGNLYNMTENRDFVESVRTYYARGDQQVLPLKKIKKLGFESYLKK